MQMPLDFTVTDKNGKKYQYYVPNTWFKKKTDATTLPKWYGWDTNLRPTYQATVQLDAPLKTVEIDPEHMLADIDMRDNKWPHNVATSFDHHVKNYPDYDQEKYNIRPDVWYNQYDGVQIGIHGNGNYMKELHHMSYTLWYNTRLGQHNIPGNINRKNQTFAIALDSKTSLYSLWQQLYATTDIQVNAGLAKYGLSLIHI